MSRPPFDLETKMFAALPVVNHFLLRLRTENVFLRFIATSGRQIKMSDACVLGILLRNLILARVPLYGVAEWTGSFAPELLGLGPQPARLNDDRVGRALDKLFDADRSAMLTDLVINMLREFKIDVREFHNDSTSLTLHGKYREATGKQVRGKPTVVAHCGHSKDHRPDLKQLVWILTVSSDGSIPVHFKVTNGNTEDSTTHLETWGALRGLVGNNDFLYVADSKLCTNENLKAIAGAGGRFVTVMPRTRAEDKLFKDWLQSNQPQWQIVRKADPARRPLEIIVGIESPVPDSNGYRLVWYKSSSKVERDAEGRKALIQKTWAELDELAKKLDGPRSRYKTAGAVAKAADEILAENGGGRWVHYKITSTQEESFRQEKRGRPNPTTRWRRTTKPRFQLRIELNELQVAHDRNSDGIFPLVTNDKTLSLKDILDVYKVNQPFVEKRHHYLKTVQEAVPVMLKSISRIEALLFLQFLALTVRALIERELRLQMAEHGHRALPLYPEGRDCKAPTAERIFEILQGLQCHRLQSGPDVIQEFPPQLSKLQEEVVKLMGVSLSAYK